MASICKPTPWMANLVGYVPETIYLTDDSLRRNVAFGLSDEDIDDQSVWRILTAAQLDVYARSLLRGVHKSGNVKSAYLAANARRLA